MATINLLRHTGVLLASSGLDVYRTLLLLMAALSAQQA